MLTGRCLAIAAVAFAVALLTLWGEFAQPSGGGPDECYMLQAAVRLLAGEGLTVSLYDAGEDLAEPQMRYMHHWPPVWSLLAAGLLAVGVPLEAVPHVLRLSFALLGAVGWLRLALRLLPGPAWGLPLLYATGLASVWTGLLHGHSPSDLPFWAVVPWLIAAVLTGLATGSSRSLLLAAVWAGLAIGFRYPAVYLVASLGASGLLLGEGGWPQRARRVVLLAVLPAAIFVGIMSLNRALHGSTIRATDQSLAWRPEDLRVTEPARLTFAGGFGVEPAILRLRPSWRQQPESVWPWVFAPMALAAGVALLRPGRAEPPLDQAAEAAEPSRKSTEAAAATPAAAPTSAAAATERLRFLGVTGLLLLGQLGFLGTVTLFLPPGDVLPLDYPRYLRELMPATGLAWMLVLWPVSLRPSLRQPGESRWALGELRWADRPPLLVLLVSATLGGGLLVSAVRAVNKAARLSSETISEDRFGRDEPTDFEQLVWDTLAEAGPAAQQAHRLLDARDGRPERFVRADGLRVTRMPTPTQAQRIGCSRRTFVMVAVRPLPGPTVSPTGQPDPANRAVAAVLAERLGLRPMGSAWDWAETWEEVTLYAGWVEPFAAGDWPVASY